MSGRDTGDEGQGSGDSDGEAAVTAPAAAPVAARRGRKRKSSAGSGRDSPASQLGEAGGPSAAVAALSGTGEGSRRPWYVVRQEHRAYFAVLSCLAVPADGDKPLSEKRRGIIVRLGKELNIPDYVRSAVEPALLAERCRDRHKALSTIAAQLRLRLPDPEIASASIGSNGVLTVPGTEVELKDKGVWRPAVVRRSTGNSEIVVHYIGWSERWDVTLRPDSDEVAPAMTHCTAEEWAKARKGPGRNGR